MDALTWFGLFAVSLMLAFYSAEDFSPWFVLAFAGACLLASAYGFLQGGLAVRRGGSGLGRHCGAPLAVAPPV